MIYSVFDHTARQYNYYEGPASVPPHGWMRKANPGMLLFPEELAARVPPGARLVGTGTVARGLVATMAEGIGTLETGSLKPRSGAETGLAGWFWRNF